jgi:hypothetical protein
MSTKKLCFIILHLQARCYSSLIPIDLLLILIYLVGREQVSELLVQITCLAIWRPARI